MKVLMLGWEFPPFISGGLGTACYGLTKGLSELGTEVLFVLPRPVESSFSTHVKLVKPENGSGRASSFPSISQGLRNVAFHFLNVKMYPYSSPGKQATPVGEVGRQAQPPVILSGSINGAQSQSQRKGLKTAEQPALLHRDRYGRGLFAEINRYTDLVCQIAGQEKFHLIHAHDWMTYPAGVALAKATGRPLIAHVHSTEFDRSGEHVNQRICDIERQGMQAAARVIAVSYLTKRLCAERFDISLDKIDVVYNAIINGNRRLDEERASIKKADKIVLFLGRITMQKGPEYFLAAAKKVLSVMDNVKFIMAGSGDMMHRTIKLAAEMGIGHRILFPGFLRGEDVAKVYRMADLYVMPSVSEPFGIAPLEAMSHEVPVIISKQSGVREILDHVLTVDFWDIDEMANKIAAVLRHPPLHSTLRHHGKFEVHRLSWTDSARQCLEIYEALTDRAA